MLPVHSYRGRCFFAPRHVSQKIRTSSSMAKGLWCLNSVLGRRPDGVQLYLQCAEVCRGRIVDVLDAVTVELDHSHGISKPASSSQARSKPPSLSVDICPSSLDAHLDPKRSRHDAGHVSLMLCTRAYQRAVFAIRVRLLHIECTTMQLTSLGNCTCRPPGFHDRVKALRKQTESKRQRVAACARHGGSCRREVSSSRHDAPSRSRLLADHMRSSFRES